MFDPIAMDTIVESACEIIKEHLKAHLVPIGEKKRERIENFVTQTSPQFRHLLRHASKELERLKPNLTDAELERALYEIKRAFDERCRKDQEDLIAKLDDVTLAQNDYSRLFQENVQRISDANSSVLTEYIVRRKVIISLLERGLRKRDDGKFNIESYMHNLVYPMGTTSEDQAYEVHNLWLLDEKLAYCSYISSDVPFNNDRSEGRADILILDSPVAISDNKNDGTAFDTIILFELKRPMRNDYSPGDNPIDQLFGYAEKLKSGTAKDKNGRTVKVSETTKFYLYAVCDITPTLVPILHRNGFSETPDTLGYYNFNSNYNAYFEVLSYDKVLLDAQKRNRVLFEKLGV